MQSNLAFLMSVKKTFWERLSVHVLQHKTGQPLVLCFKGFKSILIQANIQQSQPQTHKFAAIILAF